MFNIDRNSDDINFNSKACIYTFSNKKLIPIITFYYLILS